MSALWSGRNILYHRCTRNKWVSRRGQPINIFTRFTGAGGSYVSRQGRRRVTELADTSGHKMRTAVYALAALAAASGVTAFMPQTNFAGRAPSLRARASTRSAVSVGMLPCILFRAGHTGCLYVFAMCAPSSLIACCVALAILGRVYLAPPAAAFRVWFISSVLRCAALRFSCVSPSL